MCMPKYIHIWPYKLIMVHNLHVFECVRWINFNHTHWPFPKQRGISRRVLGPGVSMGADDKSRGHQSIVIAPLRKDIDEIHQGSSSGGMKSNWKWRQGVDELEVLRMFNSNSSFFRMLIGFWSSMAGLANCPETRKCSGRLYWEVKSSCVRQPCSIDYLVSGPFCGKWWPLQDSQNAMPRNWPPETHLCQELGHQKRRYWITPKLHETSAVTSQAYGFDLNFSFSEFSFHSPSQEGLCNPSACSMAAGDFFCLEVRLKTRLWTQVRTKKNITYIYIYHINIYIYCIIYILYNIYIYIV